MTNYTLNAWDVARADETLREAIGDLPMDAAHVEALARVIEVLTAEFVAGDTITIVEGNDEWTPSN